MANEATNETATVPVELPVRLLAFLGRMGDQAEQKRLRAVFETAARAIATLGELDLSSYEADDEGEEAYQVWEELAPLVGDTMAATHGLVDVIERELPAAVAAPTTPRERATAVIRSTQDILRTALQEFRGGMQRPENMANRWSVLGYLAAFRGRNRARIGDMVYATCRLYGPVDKTDVVPLYHEDLATALTLRRELATLAREVAVLGAEMELSSDAVEVEVSVAKLLARLREFTAGGSYRQLRVSDRRLFVRVLAVMSGAHSRVQVTGATSELFTFLKDFSINRREMLVRHDRDAAVLAGEHLARARAAVEEGVRRARLAFGGALDELGRLEGRDAAADGIVHKYRSLDLDGVGLDQLLGHLAVLEGIVRSLRD